MLNEFTKRVRLFRANFDIKQHEIAKILDQTQSNYSRFESRKLKNPPDKTFRKLARLMCCDENELKEMYYCR